MKLLCNFCKSGVLAAADIVVFAAEFLRNPVKLMLNLFLLFGVVLGLGQLFFQLCFFLFESLDFRVCVIRASPALFLLTSAAWSFFRGFGGFLRGVLRLVYANLGISLRNQFVNPPFSTAFSLWLGMWKAECQMRKTGIMSKEDSFSNVEKLHYRVCKKMIKNRESIGIKGEIRCGKLCGKCE